MSKKIEIKYVCEKCGKEPPIDKDKSNKNWRVLKIDKPCTCGGKWIIKIN